MTMRCVSERLSLDAVGDFFTTKELGRILGINAAAAYNLVRREDFPKIVVGKKYILSKAGLMRWLERNNAI